MNDDREYDMAQASLFPQEARESIEPESSSAISNVHQLAFSSSLAAMSAIEGMPLAERQDILRLSLPPSYTACPNPFIGDLLSHTANEQKTFEGSTPLTEDISAGKNDPLYFAHYYSTKVPPHAIVPHILHYTRPDDVVLDGFCGTGMTGVAAQLCAYAGNDYARYGTPGPRRAVLVDLSPAATFIAAITNAIGRLEPYFDVYEGIVQDVVRSHQNLIETLHVGWPRGESDPERRKNVGRPHSATPGHIEYTVWSDVFICPACASELVYWDLVFQGPRKPLRDPVQCSNCSSILSLRGLERAWVSHFDHEQQQVLRQAKQVPVLINYSVGKRRFEKIPDALDLQLLGHLDEQPLPFPVPLVTMPDGFNTAQPRLSHGFTHVHHFFTRRNLVLLGDLWHRFQDIRDPFERDGALYLLTGAIQRVCRLNRYMPTHDRHVGPLSGTLYMSQLTAEIPATNYALDRLDDLRRCSKGPRGVGVTISTQSATDLRNLPDASVDYIFTDPPFGGNLNYSELNTLVEAWIKVRTNTASEAVVNEVQRKGLPEYQQLMTSSFREFWRVVKPGHWMTVEFHNSQNAVWIAIQQGLWEAGFVVADVRTLDKQKGTTKQLSYGTAVKQDLVISAYRPNGGLEDRFKLEAGSEAGVWDFVRTHLQQLPIFVAAKDEQGEVIAERLDYLLFDRMVAFHVQRGVAMPLSAPEFYAGLRRHFPQRDDMFFLDNQVAEYERMRLSVKELQQLTIFVINESSAIQWLRQQLTNKPQTQADLTPQFMRELAGWEKHEQLPEMIDLLEQNFLRYDSEGPIPAQIVAWMKKSSELRKVIDGEVAAEHLREDGSIATANSTLRNQARDRWYVPDPNKAIDLEKLRVKALLREFATYSEGRGKLKLFRTEAIKAGFKQAWSDRDYATIVRVAGRLPESVLQEDADLLMYYDNASLRVDA